MKAPISYNGLSDAELVPASESILEALAKDSTLIATLMKSLPTEEQIRQAHERFQQSVKEKLPTRQAHRKELNRQLSRYALLVKVAGEDDPALLEKTGVILQRVKTAASSYALTAPANYKVTHADGHGRMMGKASPVKYAKSYDVHICQGDPTVEANWVHAAVSATASRLLVEGLTPGSVYSFRVRAIGPHGPGPWSSYVTLMAI